MTTTRDYRVIGTRPIRPDGADKVTGRAQFGADIQLPGLLYAKILRSPHPHARILSIDTNRAEKHPGVAAVITGDDFPKIDSDMRAEMGEGGIGLKYMTALAMAKDRVHYKGQPVAAVAASNPHVAGEALDLIEVVYEPLTPVDGVLFSMEDEVLLHDDLFTKRVGGEPSKEPSNIAQHIQHVRGDVAKGFADADLVIEREFRTQMVHQGYIEPTTATAQVAHDGKITIWTSTQGPFDVRNQVSQILQISLGKVKVVPMEIGGGFGGKFATYVDPVAAMLSIKTGRPVKAVMSRAEVFQATGPSSGAFIRVKMGATNSGDMVAAEAYLAYDAGAFPGSPVGAACLTGLSPYAVPHLKIDGFDVVTNHPRVQAYRAPGATPAAFAVETVIDEICEQLEIDPVEFRIKNAAQEGDRMTNDVAFPSLGYKELLETVKDHPAYTEPLEGPNRGRGVAGGFWMNGTGRSSVHITFNQDGSVNLIEGSPDIGGSRASMAIIVAEELGLEADEVHPSVVDTESVGYTDGTGGSRVTYSTGTACYKAAQDAIEQLKDRAAIVLDAPAEHIGFGDGTFFIQGDLDRKIGIREVIKQLNDTGGPFIARGVSGGLKMAPGVAAHVVDLEVDPDTGKVTILRYTAFQDVGKAIHPAYVEGQIHGGTVQGIGWALSEEYAFKDGQMMNPSFLDYRMPTTLDVPMIDAVMIEKAASDGPYGVRGVGEVPIVPPPAAIANAIYRAVGVRMRTLPMSPERLFWAMQDAEGNRTKARLVG